MRKLNSVEIRLLTDLAHFRSIAGSDRVEDHAKQRLKRLGLIGFHRKDWRWFITAAGRQALTP